MSGKDVNVIGRSIKSADELGIESLGDINVDRHSNHENQ